MLGTELASFLDVEVHVVRGCEQGKNVRGGGGDTSTGNCLDSCLRTLHAAVRTVTSVYRSCVATAAAAAVIERHDKKRVAPAALTIVTY